MDDKTGETPQKTLPFNNLFLNSGFVHGNNHWALYFLAIGITLFCYAFAPMFTFIHLVFLATHGGMSFEKVMENPNILIDPVASGIDRNYIIVALCGIFIFALGGLWLGVTKLHQKTFVSIISSYEKFRAKRFWFAFAVWSAMVVLTVGIDYYLNRDDYELVFEPKGFLISIVLLLVFMPIQTGFEEVFFRGYLMQGMALIFKNGFIPLIITSFLFGFAHMDNPEVDKFGWEIMLPYFTGFALFLGAITLLDEGLELAFGIHLANNLVSCIFVTSNESVLRTYSVFETKTQDPMGQMVLTFIMIVLAFGILWLRYRWKNFNLIIK